MGQIMTFWDMQVYAINALTKLGFKFTLYDRIPIFKTWLKVNRLESKRKFNEESIGAAREGLMGLMAFKTSGMEPPFKGKRYNKDENGQ